MQEGWSYVKDSGDFLKKKIEILAKFQKEPSLSQLMLLDSIPAYLMGQGLEALRKRLNERETPRLPWDC